MFVACDKNGKVLLAIDGEIEHVPTSFNGAALTPFELTDAEEAAYFSLPPNSGVNFVNGVFVLIDALGDAKAAQQSIIESAYATAINQPVSYMGALFQADESSQATLAKVLVALPGTTPPSFYWVDANNNQVAMTFSQLQGLAGAMMAQGWAAFQHRQAQKAAVRAATTVAAVQAVVW